MRMAHVILHNVQNSTHNMNIPNILHIVKIKI